MTHNKIDEAVNNAINKELWLLRLQEIVDLTKSTIGSPAKIPMQ